MVITGRQRYENGWCFWSEINKKGELREMKINFGERGGASTFEKKKWKAEEEEEGRSH
ncbi:hypothetical protein LINPERHAP1_LOCUS8854 [Linum perenne]